jgi:hypothetical protein
MSIDKHLVATDFDFVLPAANRHCCHSPS